MLSLPDFFLIINQVFLNLNFTLLAVSVVISLVASRPFIIVSICKITSFFVAYVHHFLLQPSQIINILFMLQCMFSPLWRRTVLNCAVVNRPKLWRTVHYYCFLLVWRLLFL